MISQLWLEGEEMITVTPEALQRLKTMVTEQGGGSLVLRLYARNVEGRVQYGMAWGKAAESDIVIESDGICLYVEEDSVPSLAGSRISYVEDVFRRGFTISSASMARGCACGNSSCGCGARH
jgi:iron-sulfur cluster assembly accessory protein